MRTRSDLRLPSLVLVLLGLVFVALLGPVWNAGWVYDDLASVVHNPSLGSWRTAFLPPEDGPLAGRPLANASFAFTQWLGGGMPLAHRLGNAALHLANAALLGALLTRMVRAAGGVPGREAFVWLLAGLWALHPVHWATVGYIAQRTELGWAFFALLALWLQARGGAGRRWLIALAAVAGAGMKEAIVVLPLALALVERLVHRPSWREVWQAEGRFFLFLAVALLGLVLGLRAGTAKAGVGALSGVSPGDYALLQSRVVWEYLHLVVWPDLLIFSRGITPWAEPVRWIFPVLTAACLVFVGLGSWRRPAVFAGPAFWGLGLVVTSSVVPLAYQPMAENRVYLASAAVVVGIGLTLQRWFPRGAWLLIGGALVACAGTTALRMKVLADPAALWTETSVRAPGNAVAPANLAALAEARADWAEAERYATHATERDPELAFAWYLRGRLAHRKGELELAWAYFERAWSARQTESAVQAGVLEYALRDRQEERVRGYLEALAPRRYGPPVYWAATAWLAWRSGEEGARERALRELMRLAPRHALLPWLKREGVPIPAEANPR